MDRDSALTLRPAGSRPPANGLGAVACYDPYHARIVRGLKKSLLRGHPVLLRLHPAAAYPAHGERIYQNDLEAHAVLFVGYDDGQGAFAVWDPWDRQAWGGQLGGLRWMRYSELALQICDGTSDYFVIVAPLNVELEVVQSDDSELRIDVGVGFHIPPAIVMDRDNQVIEQVQVDIVLPSRWRTRAPLSYCLAGRWRVGERATFSLPLDEVDGPGRIIASVRAGIGGKRPYAFRDTISVQAEKEVTGRGVAAVA